MIRKVRKLHNPFDDRPSTEIKHGQGLEWDEAIADSNSDVDEQSSQADTALDIKWLKPIIVLGFVLLFARLSYLQVVKGESLADRAEGNRTRKLSLPAPRGLIVDRYGNNLTHNGASFNLVAIPFDLPQDGLSQTIESLSNTLGLDASVITKTIQSANRKSFQPILIKSDLAEKDRILFETKAASFPGFTIITVPVRDYVEPQIYSHLLGYTSVISESELDKFGEGYELSDVVGKSGIENQYERFLKGINGREEIEVDATGKLMKVIGEVEPKVGNTLVLNIDKDLQDEIYKYFSVGIAGTKGAVVAMDPRSGEVLAFLSLPGYNTNLFSRGISNDDYKNLLGDKNLPLFNRVVAGTYPPGSTVKPMVGLAALEEGSVKENTIVHDNGKLVIPNQYNPGVSYDFVGWKRDGLGPVNVAKAIAVSSDIFFYVVTGGHSSSNITPLGIEKLSRWYRKFNLGKPTGIDLPGEKSGVVADPDWKAKYFAGDNVLSRWYLGDTYHVGIGQGDMLVTPLQVASWTATIANNGVGMKPRLLNSVKDGTGKVVYESKEQVLIPKVGTDKNLAIVQGGMRETILYGSGRQLSALPITSAGKTGTSQFDGSDPKKTHAWFTAYAPFENPQIVVTVLVEAGGEGHAAAVPIVNKVLAWWAEHRYQK